jgi:hypothetical protein
MKTAFKAFVVIFVIQILAVFVTCSDEKEKNDARFYFLNENFILVDKKENMTAKDGNPIKIRTWIIHRVNNPVDSVYVGEISSQVRSDDKGDHEFYITNELWYNKQIGNTIHFDFIRKNRFYKVKKEILEVTTHIVTSPTNVPATTQTSIVDEKFETEMKIRELEREITALKSKLNK